MDPLQASLKARAIPTARLVRLLPDWPRYRVYAVVGGRITPTADEIRAVGAVLGIPEAELRGEVSPPPRVDLGRLTDMQMATLPGWAVSSDWKGSIRDIARRAGVTPQPVRDVQRKIERYLSGEPPYGQINRTTAKKILDGCTMAS